MINVLLEIAEEKRNDLVFSLKQEDSRYLRLFCGDIPQAAELILRPLCLGKGSRFAFRNR